jgi:hypothetical protein
MEHGSSTNWISSGFKDKPPVVGEGITVLLWSDRHPGTIVEVSKSEKTFWYQEDDAERTDNNGFSESQEYIYKPNPNNPKIKCQNRRRDGKWRDEHGNVVKIGYREKYYDYSF